MSGVGSWLSPVKIWRNRVRSPSLLLVSSFCLCLLASPQSQGQHEVSPPVNLTIVSHDFHTVLKWDVLNASSTTRFNVDFRDYETALWKPSCLNISAHYCDLSDAFVATEGSASGYYIRVKAVTASQESKFALANRFSFNQNATLGPPIVQLAASGNDLTVEVKYPVPGSISRNVPFNLLTYDVHCSNLDHPKLVCLKMTPQNSVRQVKVPVGVICVSAEVHAPKLNLKGNKSEETCLTIHLSNSTDMTKLTWPLPLKYENYTTSHANELEYLMQEDEECLYYPEEEEYEEQEEEYEEQEEEYEEQEEEYEEQEEDEAHWPTHSDEDPKDTSVTTAVIPTILVCVLMFTLITTVICACKCKKKLALPKSLARIVIHEKTYGVITPTTEESSQCVLVKKEVTDDPKIDLNNDVQEEIVNSLDNVDRGTFNADESNSELVNANLNDPYAAKIDMNGTDQKSVGTDNIEVGVGDLDSSHDLCKTHLDSIKQNYTADNWGYDKPQIPFNMF